MDYLKLYNRKSNNLFQSKAWGKFQSSVGRPSWIVESDHIRGLVFKMPLLRDKSYLYSPKGPLVSKKMKPQDMQDYLKKINALAEKENAVFYRAEPTGLNQINLFKYGFESIDLDRKSVV